MLPLAGALLQSARTGATLCVPFLVSGCLLAEPPDLEDPKQTRPFIHLNNTVPSPGEIWQLLRPMSGSFFAPLTLRIQSEDLGEPVTVALHLNLHRPRYRLLIPGTDVEPSTFDTPRDVELRADFPSDTMVGCHSVTAIVAHASSFNRNPVDGLVRDDESARADAESVSWTVNIIDGDGSSNSISDCLQSGAAGNEP